MRRTGRFRFDPEAEPAYAGLKARIIARTGHAYYATRTSFSSNGSTVACVRPVSPISRPTI